MLKYTGMKILIAYYSQTGQLRSIIDSIFGAFHDEAEIDYLPVSPVDDFPFPWYGETFFQAFPESVLEVACNINPIEIPSEKKYDLIVIGYTPWFLSPSIPITSLLDDTGFKNLLKGANVLLLTGARNMWISAYRNIHVKLDKAGAIIVGNIALCDRNNNLLSAVSVIRWLIKGKKERQGWLIPDAGVSEVDINEASRFAMPILSAINARDYSSLQKMLVEEGAIDFNGPVHMMEKNAKRIFRIWAKKIIKKGSYGSSNRSRILKVFKYYLLVMIFLISPIAALVYYLTLPFRIRSNRRAKQFIGAM